MLDFYCCYLTITVSLHFLTVELAVSACKILTFLPSSTVVPPSFQKLPKDWEGGNTVDAGRGGGSKDVIVNNPLSLYCETNAVPPPVLTWYKDGYPLSSTDKVLILPGE